MSVPFLPKCVQPVKRTPETINEGVVFGKEILVPCGTCELCRARHRFARSGQAAMEGQGYLDKLGPGYVWLQTCTYRDDALVYSVPKAHSLHEFLPWVTYPDHMLEATPEGLEERNRYNFQILRKRLRLSPREAHLYTEGAYAPLPTLDRSHMKEFLRRVRREFPHARSMYAGEYGKNPVNGRYHRPHWHIVWFGLNRAEFEHVCTMWPHGFSNPDPRVSDPNKSWRYLDKQAEMSATPGRAGLYAVKYMHKDPTEAQTAAEAGRMPEFTQKQSNPALGHEYAMEHVVPKINAAYQAELESLAKRFGINKGGEIQATLVGMQTGSGIPLGSNWYGFTPYLKQKLYDASILETKRIAIVREWEAEQRAHLCDVIDTNDEAKAAYDSIVKSRGLEAEARRKAYDKRQEDKRKRISGALQERSGEPSREQPTAG